MHSSSLTWPASNKKYYNPVSKIRSLIKSLDAELMQLCSTSCIKPKSTAVVASKSAPLRVAAPHPVRKIPSNVRPFVIKSSVSQTGSHRRMISTQTRSNTGSSTSTKVLSSTNVATIQPTISIRQLANIYRSKVIDAYRNRRIFTIYGNYHTVRRALLQRGWLEKLTSGRYPKLQGLSEDVLLAHAKKGNDYEAVVISKLINHFPPFFIWQSKAQRDLNNEVRPYRNRIRRNACIDFSTKIGLIGCAELEAWYSQDGVCRISHPRFYCLNASAEERMAFIDDYRHTQCLSLLRYLAENIKTPERINDELNGTIMPTVIQFAIMQAKRQLNEIDNAALDTDASSLTVITRKDDNSADWDSFMANSYVVLRNHAKFKVCLQEIKEYAKIAQGILDKIEKKYPDYKWDGDRNLWILKPGYQSRGIGIVIRSSLDEILQWTSSNFNRRYVAQKYIERPLLIYKTKFDMRLYMLLSIGAVYVTIWLYADCYLKFSSQEFTIDDLRESIHLTNNSVQKKYKNKQSRDSRLPRNNMWSSERFKQYLKETEKSNDVWNTITYPGIKQNMIGVVLASLEETEFVENAFELYGCDFMLDENYNPILIEINATPDLTPSTEVTATICPNVLRDAIRVIVDVPRNSKAPTGQFEKIFEVNYKINRNFDPTTGLNVTGTKMTLFQPIPSLFRPRFWRRGMKTQRNDISSKNMKRQSLTGRPKKIEVSLMMSKSISGNCDSTVPLSAADKEALALQYTKPK